MSAEGTPLRVRVDVWLDVACLYRTRSEAQRACTGGKVEVNGQRAKPHREVHAGDRIRLSRPYGRVQEVVVRALAERHVPKREARLLYEDVTPPPTPAEAELWRLSRLARAAGFVPDTGAPHKRDRRLIRRLKGRD
jgi:ribosome-associated heat shock protein Hsp15